MVEDRRKPPGIGPGTYLPLTLDEMSNGFGVLLEELHRPAADGSGPSTYLNAETLGPAQAEDTPFNRAWLAVARTIEDEDRRISLLKRLEAGILLLDDPRYAKYADVGQGTMHIALLAAIANVPFSIRTTRKAFRAAFDAELKRRLASTVDPGPSGKPS